MKQAQDRLVALEAENISLRLDYASLLTGARSVATNADGRFRTHVNLMKPLDKTPQNTVNRSTVPHNDDDKETCTGEIHDIQNLIPPTDPMTTVQSNDVFLLEAKFSKCMDEVEALLNDFQELLFQL